MKPVEYSWFFFPTEKSKGMVFVTFFLEGGNQAEINPTLDILKAKFGASILSTPFSPYDSRFEIDVDGKIFTFIDDGGLLSFCAHEKDEQALFHLIGKMKQSLLI